MDVTAVFAREEKTTQSIWDGRGYWTILMSLAMAGLHVLCLQLENPYSELFTQQTVDFLAKCDDDGSFPDIDLHFEQIL